MLASEPELYKSLLQISKLLASDSAAWVSVSRIDELRKQLIDEMGYYQNSSDFLQHAPAANCRL
eukprot:33574-Hanusia_phi.AAC.1